MSCIRFQRFWKAVKWKLIKSSKIVGFGAWAGRYVCLKNCGEMVLFCEDIFCEEKRGFAWLEKKMGHFKDWLEKQSAWRKIWGLSFIQEFMEWVYRFGNLVRQN